MLSYAANDTGTVCGDRFEICPLSDGANTAHIALQGQYTTAGFEGTYDQGSGTAVAYDAEGTDLKSVPQPDQLVLGGGEEMTSLPAAAVTTFWSAATAMTSWSAGSATIN